MSTQYYCDCPVRCKKRKPVSRTTYYDHARFRQQQQPQLSDYNSFAALHSLEPSISPSSDSIGLHSSSSSHKRHRLEEEDHPGNELREDEDSSSRQGHGGQIAADRASGEDSNGSESHYGGGSFPPEGHYEDRGTGLDNDDEVRWRLASSIFVFNHTIIDWT
jgi:hypothetical protein